MINNIHPCAAAGMREFASPPLQLCKTYSTGHGSTQSYAYLPTTKLNKQYLISPHMTFLRPGHHRASQVHGSCYHSERLFTTLVQNEEQRRTAKNKGYPFNSLSGLSLSDYTFHSLIENYPLIQHAHAQAQARR